MVISGSLRTLHRHNPPLRGGARLNNRNPTLLGEIRRLVFLNTTQKGFGFHIIFGLQPLNSRWICDEVKERWIKTWLILSLLLIPSTLRFIGEIIIISDQTSYTQSVYRYY